MTTDEFINEILSPVQERQPSLLDVSSTEQSPFTQQYTNLTIIED